MQDNSVGLESPVAGPDARDTPGRAGSGGVLPAVEEILYPPIRPAVEDWLPVGGGHRIRFEESGNPKGLPVVFLHGGPGSGCTPGHRRFFDPGAYRIVLLDQRGAGQSTPRGECAANTTGELVRDLERLREALGIERWLLCGGSWGATLALAYAAGYQARVRGLILRGVFLGTRGEIAWYLRALRAFVPEAWERFARGAGARSARGILAGYRKRLLSGDGGERLAAAAEWRRYERFVTELNGPQPESQLELESAAATPSPDDALVDRVGIQLHYLAHDCFLDRGALLRGAARLAATPGVIVQGRYDLVCPPGTAHALHRAWKGSELVLVERAGHSAFDPPIAAALVRATDRLRRLGEVA